MDAAHEIRDGHITREEAIAVKKYDHELPVRHFKEFLNYVDLTENEFYQVCERFRADHIWEKRNDFKNSELIKFFSIYNNDIQIIL